MHHRLLLNKMCIKHVWVNRDYHTAACNLCNNYAPSTQDDWMTAIHKLNLIRNKSLTSGNYSRIVDSNRTPGDRVGETVPSNGCQWLFRLQTTTRIAVMSANVVMKRVICQSVVTHLNLQTKSQQNNRSAAWCRTLVPHHTNRIFKIQLIKFKVEFRFCEKTKLNFAYDLTNVFQYGTNYNNSCLFWMMKQDVYNAVVAVFVHRKSNNHCVVKQSIGFFHLWRSV